MTVYLLAIPPTESNLNVPDRDRHFTPDSGIQQTQTLSGQLWAGRLTFRNPNGSVLTALRAQLFAMQGRRNQLQVPMSLLGYERQGSGATSPTVQNAASAGATQIDVTNTDASTELWIAGDFIEISNELHVVLEDFDGQTKADLPIWPPLYKDVSAATPIDDVDPSGIFFVVSSSGISNVPHNGELSPVVTMDLLADARA